MIQIRVITPDLEGQGQILLVPIAPEPAMITVKRGGQGARVVTCPPNLAVGERLSSITVAVHVTVDQRTFRLPTVLGYRPFEHDELDLKILSRGERHHKLVF